MAITSTEINGTAFTAISSAGESGTAWITKEPAGKVIVYHTTTGLPANSKKDEGFNLKVDETTTLTADSGGTDVFYAICSSTNDTATVSFDSEV